MKEYSIRVNPEKKIRTLGNKVSTICIWDYRESFLGRGEDGQIKRDNPFVERVQFMTATGGNEGRDLFRDPLDRTVMDDYDFTKLLTACENALRLGVKPFLKTGVIPLKFSLDPQIGKFEVNTKPPVSMDDYYNYIYALCEALKAKFGIDEVRTWSWGVFTEFENLEWFKADEDPTTAGKIFCDIYDYTVAAITDSLGDDVIIGAHAMVMREILKITVFEPEEFIRHCAKDRNAKNGKKVKLDYMGFSYYDPTPRGVCSMTFSQLAHLIRRQARKYGLNDLRITCEEGRINSGLDCKELSPRTVGIRYQAAMDADLLWQMVNFDVDYFAAWSYRSGGLMGGIKSLGSHVAENYYRMVGMTQIESDPDVTEKSMLRVLPTDFRVRSIAGTDGKGKTIVMVYNYKPARFTYDEEIKIKLTLPTAKKNGESTAEGRFIDDEANFFPHWEKDRNARGLETKGRWSEDSPEVMTEGFDAAPYEKYSHLIPKKLKTVVKDGVETAEFTMVGNSAVFVEFTE